MNSKNLTIMEIAEALSRAAKRAAVSCVNCVHFSDYKDADICKLNGMKPPSRVIVKGCARYSGNMIDDDEIPF